MSQAYNMPDGEDVMEGNKMRTENGPVMVKSDSLANYTYKIMD